MRKIIIVALLLTVGINFINAQNKCKSKGEKSKEWTYEIETVGVGSEGTYMIKVTDYFKSPQNPYLEELKKSAVHAIIYKGIPAGGGSIKQPALLQENNRIEGGEAYLDTFFGDDGKAASFVTSVAQGSTEIIRIKKPKQYKISVVLSVSKDKLRDELIKANVIKPLDENFR